MHGAALHLARPTALTGRPLTLLAREAMAAVLAYPLASALLATVPLAAVLAYPLASALLASVALAAVLAQPLASALLALAALAAVRTHVLPCLGAHPPPLITTVLKRHLLVTSALLALVGMLSLGRHGPASRATGHGSPVATPSAVGSVSEPPVVGGAQAEKQSAAVQ